MGIGLVEIHY